MEIVRIPSTYYSQTVHLSAEDSKYVFDAVFGICNGADIDIEESYRGGIVLNMIREINCLHNESIEAGNIVYIIRLFNKIEDFIKIGVTYNKKSRFSSFKSLGYNLEEVKVIKCNNRQDTLLEEKKLHNKFSKYKYNPKKDFGGSTECFDISILDFIYNINPKNSTVNSNQSKSIQEVSKDTKELALNKKNPDIDILITELKNKADELGIAYDKTKDRMFAKHITQAKEFGEFCEKIQLSPVEFAINIMIASDRIGFWKGTCSGPMKIYQNYSEVYNLIKTKKESSEIINIT